ncbi:L-lactate utilization protein LutC [Rubricella aquisinus]|uniref:L-lactate utilization protein LutC n=1 Tax=Rubricella aquisinus TaxID=2028108 RepID=A0A840WG63_9RHOB|nr:LUD domain-containing protein [Rubricella aquisinus]MBB5514139.1 L-lactate utilization protein LutC [Rubricella aquisinus]
MSGRDEIMQKLTRTLDQGDGRAARQAAVRAHMAKPGGPVPSIAREEDAVGAFIERAIKADATVSRIASADDLPKALAEELRNRNLPAAIRHGADPMFAGLDWGGLETSVGIGRIEEPATLSRAEFGVAETGTCVLASGADNPVTLTFLGETHFVVLDAGDIHKGYEDMWAALRARGLTPRTVNMVTGPSRSADIGQQLQLGAHGPVALHVFVIG